MAELPGPADDTASASDPASSTALRQPKSCTQLFVVFTRLALQGFGGVLPVAHHELVERERWLDNQQFAELLAAGQVLPGPNVVNVGLMFGDRHFGWRGALAACAGLLLLPMLIVLAMALAYQRWQHLPQVAGALRGVGVVAAALVLATPIKLSSALQRSAMGQPAAWSIALATALMVGWLRWPLVAVVLGLGGLGMALAARQLRRSAARELLRPPTS